MLRGAAPEPLDSYALRGRESGGDGNLLFPDGSQSLKDDG